MSLKYSVTIRTTGKGGEKYRKLLNSIKVQTIQPDEVLVVLPEGTTPPNERLGIETFVFAQKGMMTQRICGIEEAKNEIVLCCDDDLEFDSEFVKKLIKPIEEKQYDIVVGELLDLLPKKKSIKNISPILSLKAIPMSKRNGKFVKIIKSGGWRYYRYDSSISEYLPTESAAGAMMMITKKAWKILNLRDELWAQHEASAPMEDQIMFYKAYLLKIKTAVVTNAHYIHNDSKNSLSSHESLMKKNLNSGFNHRVFWYRFIYEKQSSVLNRMWSHYLFFHSFWIGNLFQLATSIYKKECFVLLKEFIKGDNQAKSFIKSDNYHLIPKI